MKPYKAYHIVLIIFFLSISCRNHPQVWRFVGQLCVLTDRLAAEHVVCNKVPTRLIALVQDNNTQILMAYLQEDPNNQILRLRLGQRLWFEGKTDDALAIWREDIEISYYFAQQSQVALESGDLENSLAMANISLSIQSEPKAERHDMYRSLCRSLFDMSELEEAVFWCERDVLATNSGWSLLTLSDVWFRMQENEKAQLILDQVIIGDYAYDHQLRAYQKKGLIFLSEGKALLAVEALHLAQDDSNQSPWLYIGLAKGYLLLEEVEQACIYLDQAEDLNYILSSNDIDAFADCL